MAADTGRRELLRSIQTTDFAAVDLSLFLNTHPGCYDALQELREQLSQKRQYTDQYERLYGPITMDGMAEACEYDWIERPWPWEMEA